MNTTAATHNDFAANIVKSIHAVLSANTAALPNSELLAHMLATWQAGGGVLPERMGLAPAAYRRMLARHFPQTDVPEQAPCGVMVNPERAAEAGELRRLLLEHRADEDEEREWMTDIVVAACMGGNHLWQDLGLWSRKELSELMRINFPALAARNDRDMKWKKFLYKQLCMAEGIYTCRAPSCQVCVDYQVCFGPEH